MGNELDGCRNYLIESGIISNVLIIRPAVSEEFRFSCSLQSSLNASLGVYGYEVHLFNRYISIHRVPSKKRIF